MLQCYLYIGRILTALLVACVGRAAVAGEEIQRGFSATHDPSHSQFQPVLSDPSGIFSLGFLRLNSTLLDLAVLHLPSSLPLWRAIPHRPALWSAATSLSFDGNLILTDRTTATVLWSTASTINAGLGDRVALLNSSCLQIQSSGGSSSSILWQSFDFPSDTIVQNQNFTSTAALFSSNRHFSMRLGANYFALFTESAASAMYWKHTALEAKAQIVPAGGPIYARVDPDGFLGMYQKEGPPADVLSFDTFNRGVRGLRRMTLESDGNLRAYYWNTSAWIRDYTTITEPCQLPTTCGSYSICATAGSPQCTSLANGTDAWADLCGSTGGEVGGLYWVVRRRGVELANKELVGFQKVGSVEECEGLCERNCSCWGAVYSNATGYCYRMDYPAQMLVEGDDRKLGYFKVRSLQAPPPPEATDGRTNRAKVALLALGILMAAAAAGFGAYRIWERRRRRMGMDGGQLGGGDEGLAPGPYKNLGSSSSASFNSIELSNLDSFRK